MIQFNSTIRRVSTATEPKCLRITIDTQELQEEEAAKLIGLKDAYAWCAFKEFEAGQIESNDLNIPDIVPEFKNDKSNSQRLRNVLWIFWRDNVKGKEEWSIWYDRQMEKIISKIKETLT